MSEEVIFPWIHRTRNIFRKDGRMNSMGTIALGAVLLCALIAGCGRNAEVQERAKMLPAAHAGSGKELEEIRKTLKGDIRIKLRRDGKGTYSWEVTGKDPQEVIRANAVLARRINDGQRE